MYHLNLKRINLSNMKNEDSSLYLSNARPLNKEDTAVIGSKNKIPVRICT